MTTPDPLSDERIARAQRERDRLHRTHPEAYADGERRAREHDASYPPDFTNWPLDERNAWFAGWHLAFLERQRVKGRGAKGGSVRR